MESMTYLYLCTKAALCLLFIHPPAPWVGSQPCGAQ